MRGPLHHAGAGGVHRPGDSEEDPQLRQLRHHQGQEYAPHPHQAPWRPHPCQ